MLTCVAELFQTDTILVSISRRNLNGREDPVSKESNIPNIFSYVVSLWVQSQD